MHPSEPVELLVVGDPRCLPSQCNSTNSCSVRLYRFCSMMCSREKKISAAVLCDLCVRDRLFVFCVFVVSFFFPPPSSPLPVRSDRPSLFYFGGALSNPRLGIQGLSGTFVFLSATPV
ncbi:hypothetical protein CAOG_009846 [Capsaspora owczarzaki ATCC 30864]|uniref:Uncharacterized protein n=1 Tax=Capsaspora owczarzaki (strain ATCC 30864) TaxID=595528 RepID=A0A0D2X3R6_CAPO3|nr:hypothetical protein CAOG_009846 [Capsaspora owczarzaki ATCC 30864]